MLIKIIATCGIRRNLLTYADENPLEFIQSFFTTLYSVRHSPSPMLLLTLDNIHTYIHTYYVCMYVRVYVRMYIHMNVCIRGVTIYRYIPIS